MRYEVTETQIDYDQSVFRLIKIEDSGRRVSLGDNFSSLRDAEKAIDRNINFPKVLPSIQYDGTGKRIDYLQLAYVKEGVDEYG